MAKLVLIWMSLSPYPKDGKQGLVVSEGLEHAFLRASSYGLWIRPLECLSLTSCSPFTTPNVLDPSLSAANFIQQYQAFWFSIHNGCSYMTTVLIKQTKFNKTN